MKIVIDLDRTITRPRAGQGYEDSEFDVELVEKLKDYRRQGFEIVIYTSRNMRTYQNNIGRITANTVPSIVAWLQGNDIPFDELHVGKPWCGHGGFYVDDKAIRPDEFKRLSLAEIHELVGEEAAQ